MFHFLVHFWCQSLNCFKSGKSESNKASLPYSWRACGGKSHISHGLSRRRFYWCFVTNLDDFCSFRGRKGDVFSTLSTTFFGGKGGKKYGKKNKHLMYKIWFWWFKLATFSLISSTWPPCWPHNSSPPRPSSAILGASPAPVVLLAWLDRHGGIKKKEGSSLIYLGLYVYVLQIIHIIWKFNVIFIICSI